MRRLSEGEDVQMPSGEQGDSEVGAVAQEPVAAVERSDRKVVCFADEVNAQETAITGSTTVETCQEEEQAVNAEELTAIYRDLLKNPNSGDAIAGVFDNKFIDVMDLLVQRRVGRGWRTDGSGLRRSRRLQMMSAGEREVGEPSRDAAVSKGRKTVSRRRQDKITKEVDPADVAAPLAGAPSDPANEAKESDEGGLEQRTSVTSAGDGSNANPVSERERTTAHEAEDANDGNEPTNQQAASGAEGNRAGDARAVGSARDNFKDATDTIDVGGRLYATRVECLFSDTVVAVRKMKNRDEEGALFDNRMDAMQMDHAHVSAAEEQSMMAELALAASSFFKGSENTPLAQANIAVGGGAAGVEAMEMGLDQTSCSDDADKTLVPQSDKDETIWGGQEVSVPFQRWSNRLSLSARLNRQLPPLRKQKRQRPLDAHRMRINKCIAQSTNQRIKSLISTLAKINKDVEYVDWLGRNLNLKDFETGVGVGVNQWDDDSDSDKAVVQSGDGRDFYIDSEGDGDCEDNEGNGEEEADEQVRAKPDPKSATKNALSVSPLSIAYLANDFNSYENPMSIAIWRDFRKLFDQAKKAHGSKWGQHEIRVDRSAILGFEGKRLLPGRAQGDNSIGMGAKPVPESRSNDFSARTDDSQRNDGGVCGDSSADILESGGRDAVSQQASMGHPPAEEGMNQTVQRRIGTIEIPEAFIREVTNLGPRLDMLRQEGGGLVKELARLDSDTSQATTIITVRFASRDAGSTVDNDVLSDTTITDNKNKQCKKGKDRANKRKREAPVISFDARPRIKMSAEGELAAPARRPRGPRPCRQRAKSLYDNFRLHSESKFMSALSNRERFDMLSQSKRYNCREIVKLRTKPNVMLLQEFERALMSGNHNLGKLEIEAMATSDEEGGSRFVELPSENAGAVDNQEAGEAALPMSSTAQSGCVVPQSEREPIQNDYHDDGPGFDTEMFEAESETDYSDIEVDDEAVNNYLVTHGFDDRTGPAMREHWIRQARHDIARERSMLELQSSNGPRRPRRRIVRPRQVNMRIFTRRLEDWLITVSRSGKPQVLGSEMFRHFRSKFKTKAEKTLITPAVLMSSLMMIMGNHENWDLHNTQDGSLIQTPEEAVELYLKFRDFIPLPPIVRRT